MFLSPQILARSSPRTASFSTPLDLTGLILWLDMSVTASISITSGRINSVTDQSPLAQTANWFGFNKPVYNATGFNSSYPAMTDDTTTVAGALAVTSFPMGTGNTLTAWYVGTNSGTNFFGNTNGRALSYVASGANEDFDNAGSWCVNRSGQHNDEAGFTRNSIAGLFAATITSPHRIIVTVNSSGVQTIYVNGVATTAATVSGNWVSNGTFRFGALQDPGNPTFTSGWDGALAEGGVATAWHDATTIAALDTYLKNKWGL